MPQKNAKCTIKIFCDFLIDSISWIGIFKKSIYYIKFPKKKTKKYSFKRGFNLLKKIWINKRRREKMERRLVNESIMICG